MSACLWIVLVGCGEDGGGAPLAPAEPDTVVASISVLTHRDRTIGVLGGYIEVGAVALNEDGEVLYGSTLDPALFSWSSSAPGVVTVDETPIHPSGPRCCLVTAVGEGTATITATSRGRSGSMTVTVQDRAGRAWSVPLAAGQIVAGIAIGADGTIYVGTNDNSGSVWYAVSPQGGVLWTSSLPITGTSAPAIGDDGTLYIGSKSAGDGSLMAVDRGGTVLWMRQDLDKWVHSSPALGPDGTIYVATGHHVYALDPHGEILWIYEVSDDAFFLSTPAVANDGTIYVGGEDGRLHAISPDGSPRWTFATADGLGRIQSSPSIGPDGTIYFGSGRDDGRLYAVNPDGTERWRSAELDHRGLYSTPSIGPDGTIYVGGDGVFALDPGGSIRWHLEGSQVGTTPILGADGTVYVGAAGGVTALDAQGRVQWTYFLGGHIFGTPAIGVDGVILAGSSSASSEGTLHAIVETNSANGGYAGSPWPTARGNRANSGRDGG